LNCEVPFDHIWIERVINAMFKLDIAHEVAIYYWKIIWQPSIQ